MCVLASVPFAYAQGIGKISGVVSDKGTGFPIPGANVVVETTTRGANTNISGEFFILNLPIGTYDLKVTSLGYETKLIKGIEVTSEETYELMVQLSEEAILGQEVVVTAER